ncbi:protein translocase SEC61 complex subunit gamma [Methanotrichaceae archaeon M04Ac]|jgi:protein transport protein SEC61 subunit gamma-like protein|uniref:Protein translocase subunit SecE n=1 Tax=Candidatus Methanocrinis alkalitolerans TaxID=3033395 RepID=A0ABT5XE03_9EURY|nr:protein translocase SEC61 complex subunit gamma [Candidatus Methanocrinis alkalitolerans]MCR3882788.1 protein translocase SEC61 complex subunit gamma [Methanothrix sp.]MDF0592939.1 protein translocase SEC61 complex subunit gamma [Candidatus Methanocrinis alkalitolerans]
MSDEKAKTRKNNVNGHKGELAEKLADMNVKIGAPKFNYKDYLRVLKLARKPTREEFKTISKISILGIALIGMLGFIIYVFLTELPKAF